MPPIKINKLIYKKIIFLLKDNCFFLMFIYLAASDLSYCTWDLVSCCCCCCCISSVVSDSVRSHRRQPAKLLCSWDSPGKNTGVGCHFLLQCMKVKSECEVAQSCPTLKRPHGLQPTRLLRPWEFPGKSTGVGCHCLLRVS